VLLGEPIRDHAGRDEAEQDEHLAELLLGLALDDERLLELLSRDQALVDQDLSEGTPNLVGRIHRI
jgi:hypothetical protein